LLRTPASGYRTRETGALTGVGDGGHYWSSSSYNAANNNAGYLRFDGVSVKTLNGTNRSHALSVRCVQHLPGSLFGFSKQSITFR